MADTKLVEEVLGSEPYQKHNMLLVGTRIVACFYDDDGLADERARQAALGHRALRLLTKLGDFTGLAVGDAAEAEAIIKELRDAE